MFFPFRMSFASKVRLSFPFCLTEVNNYRDYVTPRIHFVLFSRVTVPQGHFCK